MVTKLSSSSSSTTITSTLLTRRLAPPSEAPSPAAPLPLPFDLVESIFSLLPAPDLLSAAAVSPTWRRTALSSPRRCPPSLLLHTHSLRHLSSSSSPAAATSTSTLDDPRSATWLHLPPLPSPPFPLRSSTSDTLLYTLSSSQFSFSSDPLHLRWTHLPSPAVWRVDPVVARVGPGLLLVAAGGVSEFEDDPLAVEVFDGDRWTPARSMPDAFKHSASASYLSATVAGGRLHVVDRGSALMSSFDAVKDTWSEPVDLLAGVERRPFAVAVAPAGDGLVVAGVMGRQAEVAGVRLWEARGETGLVEVGEMPAYMVGRFARGPTGSSAAGVSEVEVRTADAGGHVYVYNPSDMGEVFYWRAGGRGCGNWGSVETRVERTWSPTRSVVVTVAAVGVEDLREALRRGSPSPEIEKELIV